jgi:hypothetical protein
VSQADPPGAAHVEHDTPMTAIYIRVVILEAAIVIALWLFGRAFA